MHSETMEAIRSEPLVRGGLATAYAPRESGRRAMFSRALLPVDGSELALTAIPWLLGALDGNAEVLIVTVIEDPAHLARRMSSAGHALGGGVFSQESLAQAVEEQEREGAAHLTAALDRIASAHPGVRVSTLVLRGEPGPQIVRTATEHSCDMIVMATHGRSGWRRAVLGSVTDYVVRHSTGVPVLLVTHAAAA